MTGVFIFNSEGSPLLKGGAILITICNGETGRAKRKTKENLCLLPFY